MYRTLEQFEEIVEKCLNGNWTDAAKDCIEFGFWANDLISFQEQKDFGGFAKDTDIAVLVEITMQLRNIELKNL